MKQRIYDSMNNEKGFTLVELAVVMVIIGLLVGGILKGQEMIANAQVTSTVAQIKAVDAATGTFRDIYDAFPGDMAGAETRLPNCTVASGCAPAAADGNTRLVNSPLAASGDEEDAFFLQLEAADLVSGVNGRGFLDASISGNDIKPGFVTGAAALGLLATPRSGHYLAVVQAASNGTAGMKPIDAARMDRKLDDGDPTTGSAGGVDGTAACGVAGSYNENVQATDCGFVVRIQG